MQNKDKNPEKLPLSRILSNYFYLLHYAFKKDASLIFLSLHPIRWREWRMPA